ncbi:SRPBCC family protein [Arthrobacter oryzae]|uniref:Polyketide cyclase/dehydrase/lipid transport protein n=1 Tax=Arthrobacter oryzae TaxID=409290 RepID=A0A495EA14_9MICC|nr:SRPBCC family protein [Arthrobacter oryzae]RKR13748.1 polyketide cyclase/dehydrase/lipid transport protein [Arthrobacter oryzae]
MAHAENETTISRSPEDVYAFLADGLNNPKWRSGIQHITLKSGSPGALGTVYSQTLTGPGGRPIAGDYEITTADPGQRLCFQVVAGPARPSGEYHLSAAPGGTKVRFTLDLQPKGLMKIAGPMIARTMQTEVAQLTNLKSVLEAA